MAQQGASLQGYNNELVGLIEEMKIKKANVDQEILRLQEEKMKIQNDMKRLNDRLRQIDDMYRRKAATKAEIDKTLSETEAAYTRILKSSETLLSVLRRQSSSFRAGAPE